MSGEDLPGRDGSVLDPGAVGRISGGAIERKAAYLPRDEEIPPPGVNWYEHNWGQQPAIHAVKVQVDIRDMAKHIEPFVVAADVGSIAQAWHNAKINVSFDKNTMIVNVKVTPS